LELPDTLRQTTTTPRTIDEYRKFGDITRIIRVWVNGGGPVDRDELREAIRIVGYKLSTGEM
jgi:hypothetical protein